MRIQVILFNQDDPKKCTAEKLIKFGLAKTVKKTSNKTLILDPFAKKTLLKNDKIIVDSVTGIDCSWNLASQMLTKKFSGCRRKLPPLLAGNPVNYSKLNKLTTVEAISAALFIFGQKELALTLLDKFKWGHTFYDLNRNLLEEYSNADSEEDLTRILNEYGLSQLVSN